MIFESLTFGIMPLSQLAGTVRSVILRGLQSPKVDTEEATPAAA